MVQGCQNIEISPPLPDGAYISREKSHCFYYKCIKCIYSLNIDILGITITESKSVFVAEVKFLQLNEDKGWKSSPLFKIDFSFHGEVAEVIGGYISRMKNLTGVAINGWSSEDAAKVFTDVDKTFMGTKDKGSKDSEIDWLISSGNILFIFEVGMRDYRKLNDKKRVNKLIHYKISRATKDAMVVRHLLKATDFTPEDVHFMAAFPNIPFENVETKMRVPEQRASLNRLISREKSP